MRGKRYVPLLLLFLLLSSPLFSDVALTDDEFEELVTIFDRLYTTLDEQATQITMLETQLQTADERLERSQISIETLKATLSEVEKSYATLKREQIGRVIVAAVVSAAVGFLGGVVTISLL